MEIERKFLVDRFPEGLPLLKEAVVYQGYLCTHPTVRIRSTETADGVSYVLCFKGKGTIARQEIEMDLTKEQFFHQPVDYIVDAIDMVCSKLSLIQTAKELQIPIISAMGTGNKLDPSQFQITDISKTTLCPLARVVRKELKARGILHHTVLYSTEEPRVPLPLESPPPGRRSLPASVAWVPSCAGLMIAGYVVQALADI